MIKHDLNVENCWKNKNHPGFRKPDNLIFFNRIVNIFNMISILQSIFLSIILYNPIQLLYTGYGLPTASVPSMPCNCETTVMDYVSQWIRSGADGCLVQTRDRYEMQANYVHCRKNHFSKNDTKY